MLTLSAKAVESAMLKLGVGVYELARIANIPPKTISLVHRRDSAVTLRTLAKLAKALAVNPYSLLKKEATA